MKRTDTMSGAAIATLLVAAAAILSPGTGAMAQSSSGGSAATSSPSSGSQGRAGSAPGVEMRQKPGAEQGGLGQSDNRGAQAQAPSGSTERQGQQGGKAAQTDMRRGSGTDQGTGGQSAQTDRNPNQQDMSGSAAASGRSGQAGAKASADMSASASTQVSVTQLQDRVREQGEFVQINGLGEGFKPRGVNADWKPYTNGRWIFNQKVGWYFESDEPWAEVTYHYGRWYDDPDQGWVWIADTEWAPAWVEWRRSKQHVGWRPLPPENAPRRRAPPPSARHDHLAPWRRKRGRRSGGVGVRAHA